MCAGSDRGSHGNKVILHLHDSCPNRPPRLDSRGRAASRQQHQLNEQHTVNWWTRDQRNPWAHRRGWPLKRSQSGHWRNRRDRCNSCPCRLAGMVMSPRPMEPAPPGEGKSGCPWRQSRNPAPAAICHGFVSSEVTSRGAYRAGQHR